MESLQLGTSHLKASPIIFGGNVFGWTLDEKESFRILDEMLDLGITMIDTADVYSRWVDGNEGGESERIIGKWLKERKNRDKITLATKVGADMGKGSRNISKNYILDKVEDSLKRLQTDYIDLYFTHWDDDKTPVEETLEAYQQLIKEGKVRVIGASNLSANRLKESLDASAEKNLPKYQVFQPEYNLMSRKQFEEDLAPLCKTYELGVTPYFSLASGFLTGKYRSEKDMEDSSRKGFVKDYLNRRGLEILNVLDQISEEHQVDNAAVALRWLMQKDIVTAPIASATKSKHLANFTEAIEMKLSSEEMGKLDEVSKM
ncbi:aldo/keto reductase [Mesonia sp. K4-1]|uniref:aldo/keto reductase n=1 Tax=Mesonia sp. K4-1 TaxID=2602760 RepID=UPI0011CC0EE9|nr:aldo/keto reductase [Mesonia sp. K4-1]TXK76449.1 aldo/keto reductase [Mesonia sp. K4-1]